MRTAGKHTAHPGLGETGRFHPRGSGDPLPKDTVLTFALVGNQNSGKTTLFNQLTGSNQHVGNFPGVTVDRKDGVIRGKSNTRITDLPGIYSMSPYSSEELVSRNFVLQEKPKGIINIVDATNIERNLYLTMQLLESGIPTVVALSSVSRSFRFLPQKMRESTNWSIMQCILHTIRRSPGGRTSVTAMTMGEQCTGVCMRSAT